MLRLLLWISVCGLSFSGWTTPEWSTLRTAHFNVHFTDGHDAWAQSAAQELEQVRQFILTQQNRSLPAIADVVVFDPIHGANGFALPSTDSPLMALFTTPPQSDTVISNSRGWQQLLILHEYVHLVHLSQPSRNRWRQRIRNSWDLYDLNEATMPRWVAEGYATLLESKMTGRGRLYDNFSEAILTRFAQQGALPTYRQLNGADERYLSNTMAYLLGGRFLAWLEKNYSEQTLDAVWVRMQAVKKRRFQDAFTGVFGQPAERLYHRFIAEYTYHSMQQERAEPKLDDTVWMKADFSAHSPALSPNKSLLALVERNAQGAVYLNVYANEDNAQAAKEFASEQQQVLARDEQDIVDKAPEVFHRERQYQLPSRNHESIRYPQWLDDSTLLFVSGVKEHVNDHHVSGELFRWSLNSNTLTQLTTGASIRRFTVGKKSKYVYAEQARYGYSDLVSIHLSPQHITPLTAHQLGEVYDFPTLSHSEHALAYLKTGLNRHWQLIVRRIDNGIEYEVPMPAGYQYVAHPQWHPDDGSIVFIAGVDGDIDMYSYEFETEKLTKLTKGQQVVGYPTFLDDDTLLFLSTNAQGVELRVISTYVGHEVQAVNIKSGLKSSQMNTTQKHTRYLPEAQIYEPDHPKLPYDIWQQSSSLALGVQYNSASSSLIHVGVKGSDFLEQLSWQVGLVQDTAATKLSGYFADIHYEDKGVKWQGKVFDVAHRPHNEGGSELVHEQQREGGFVQLSNTLTYSRWAFKGQLAAHISDLEHRYVDQRARWLRVGAAYRWSDDQQDFALANAMSWHWYEGEIGEHVWQGYDVAAHISGKVAHIPWYIQTKQMLRQGSNLQLGGFVTPILDNNIEANQVFIPELALSSRQGKHYQQFGAGVSWRVNKPWLYYHQHHLDNEVLGNSYGFQFTTFIEKSSWLGRFAPAGVSDLRIDLGLGRVSGRFLENENRVWLGVWYDQK
ncbi:hypothetical protein J8L98_10675 [Pseudoalteromonas sp. MMG013]|uniref:TolB family protein n=1 Tax=Pseudoalteromonas sp. MMG013 TaxID=2822687 RepID=UPI001B35CE59|nr:hypothetical protein [Pseudoalteromonas sp. MMG013]MBQ4862151.1 hypothetical protein [Pseudoalteromonas sp. MMG013]